MQQVIFALTLLFALASPSLADPQADFERGYTAYKAENYTEAAKWLLRAAKQGNAEAQFNLGFMYFAGQGVAQDYGKARNGFTKPPIKATSSPSFF
jgi:TPR repeat protein